MIHPTGFTVNPTAFTINPTAFFLIFASVLVVTTCRTLLFNMDLSVYDTENKQNRYKIIFSHNGYST